MRISTLAAGRVQEGAVTPEDFGLPRSPAGAIDGGNAETNAGILLEVLDGKPHPSRNAFVLNAAAALAIAKDLRLQDARDLAQKTLDTGRARECLEKWRAASHAKSASATQQRARE